MIPGASALAKELIVCADDFALHEAVSVGVALLTAQGRLSATSVMVLSPRWAGDAALLHDVRASLDVGLHLDWTSEFAQASGHGLSLGRAMMKALGGGFARGTARDATRGVIRRQFDAFERHWKAAPDFVDGHQHVQQFFGIREALLDVIAERYGAGPKPYLRISRSPAGYADMKARVIAAMGANALEKIAANAGLTCSAALLGIYDFAGDEARYAQRMAAWLATAPARCIIMCHPAQAAVADDPIGAARSREFAYLNGSGFADTLTRLNVRLIRGHELARA